MYLYEEIYFEINARGTKNELGKLEKFLTSGELDEFFDVSRDYINYDDAYANGENICEMVFTNDELGIEASEFDPEEFAEVFCKAAKALDVKGTIYDIDDNEFTFTSPEGVTEYYNEATKRVVFNDELDEAAREEELDEED